MTTDGSPLWTPAADLPTDVAACHALIRQLLDRHHQLEHTVERLEYRLQDVLRRLYGRSSEKIDPQQLALFAEVLEQLEAQAARPPEPAPAPPAKTAPSKGHGRRKLPPDLPRRKVVHDLPEAEKPCPCCGKPRQVIGQEVSEQLEYEPAKLTVIEHVRLKYACRACEAEAEGPQIATAAALFSLISTCQRHQVDPFAYLRDVLTRIAAQPISRLPDLLPDHWEPAAPAPSVEPSPAAAQATAQS